MAGFLLIAGVLVAGAFLFLETVLEEILEDDISCSTVEVLFFI